MIDLRLDCVAHYKMNDAESSTIVIDSQGFSNGTAQQNTEDLTTTGKINEALIFNGSSDYVDCNNKFLTTFRDSFTVCGWVKLLGLTSYGAIFGRYYGTGHEIWITNTFTSIEFSYESAGASNYYKIIMGALADSDWHFFTFLAINSVTSATFEVYLDNVLKGSGTKSFTMSDFTIIDNIYIGNDSDSSPLYFDGNIDNVMIFNKALDEDEIAFLWNGGNGTEELVEPAGGQLPRKMLMRSL